MNEKASRLRQYSNRSRRVFMQAVGGAGAALAISSSASASEHDGPTGIDSCTVIDEPGEYELVADLEPTEIEGASCIEVQADDVTIIGNGHTIDGHAAAEDERFAGAGIGVNTGAVAPTSEITQLRNVTVENLSVTGFGAGIRHEETRYGRVADVTAHDNGAGISFNYGVVDVDIENCRLTGGRFGYRTAGYNLEELGGPSSITLGHCTIEQNVVGISVGHETHNHEIHHSRIVNNGHGADHSFVFSSGHNYHDNVICRNRAYGIRNEDYPADEIFPAPIEDIVEATDNYWGAPNGPSSYGDPPEPFTDPETGAPADGDGDAISESLDPGVANVHFDPFLESYPEDVGTDL